MQSLTEKARDLWGRYRRYYLLSFVSGLLAYGFALTNILNNHDSVFYMPNGYGAGLSSGRWFLQLLGDLVNTVWGGNYHLPLFNGLLAILLVSGAACLVLSLLEIRQPLFAGPTVCLFTVAPCLGGAVLFLFTVHYYALAILFAVAGAWLTTRYRRGFLPGAVLIALSLGIYQGYFPLAASLLLLWLLGRCLTWGERPLSRLIWTWLKCLAALALAMGLYFLVLRLLLAATGTQLNTYMGIDQMGVLSLSELPGLILRMYRDVLLLPLQPKYGMAMAKVVRLAVLLCHVLSFGWMAWLLIRSRLRPALKLLAALAFALLPAAFDLIVLMCPHSDIFEIMSYGLLGVYLTPVLLLERIQDGKTGLLPLSSPRWRRAASALLALTLSLTALNYIWQDNINHMTMYYADQQTVNYFSSMLTAVRSAEGYSQDKRLAILGEAVYDPTFYNFIYESSGAQYRGNYRTYIDTYSWRSWLKNYFAFDQPMASQEETEELRLLPEVQAMPLYPDQGSVRVFGDVIVLKLSS